MNFLNLILLSDTVINGGKAAGEVQEAVTTVTNSPAGQQAPVGLFGLNPTVITVGYIIFFVVIIYFFMIRPQKKREKELVTMQNSIGVGDWVMTSSGFYGKVVDMGDQVFVVEFGTNKGVRIPVRKSEIVGNKEPNLSSNSSEDK